MTYHGHFSFSEQTQTQGFMTQSIQSNNTSDSYFPRPSGKAQLFKVTHICENPDTGFPLLIPCFFPGSWPSSTAKLHSHHNASAPKPCTGKPDPGSIKAEAAVSSCSTSQGLPHTRLVSLGKLKGFRFSLLTPVNPNLKQRGKQSPRTLCLPLLAVCGLKNLRQLPKPPGHYLQGLLGCAASGELHQSPSRTGCSGWAGSPTLGEGTAFPCPSSKETTLKS